jgi:TRAP-type C4-dicarboxylate transport system permease small subunit
MAGNSAGQGSSQGALAALERAALASTRALSVIGLVALMVLAFLTLANGLLRWLANQPIAGVVDVGALAIAIAVCCCIPVSLMERSHIAFRVVSAASPRLGRLLDVFAALAVGAVLVLMAYEFYAYAKSLVATGEQTYVLKIPAAPFWFAADAILWIAVAVQAAVVAVDAARLFGYRSQHVPMKH